MSDKRAETMTRTQKPITFTDGRQTVEQWTKEKKMIDEKWVERAAEESYFALCCFCILEHYLLLHLMISTSELSEKKPKLKFSKL